MEIVKEKEHEILLTTMKELVVSSSFSQLEASVLGTYGINY